MKRVKSDVVVMGAGIAGTSTAYFLSKKGAKVVLIDKGRLGAEASGRNGGGVRQQYRDPQELPLAMAAVNLWGDLDRELNANLEYIRGGSYRLLNSATDLEDAKIRVDREQSLGLPVKILDSIETKTLLPILSPDLDILGSTYCTTDGTANPLLVMRALGRAVKRSGVCLRMNEPVKTLLLKNSRVFSAQTERCEYQADVFVNSAGPWARELVRTVGLDFPVRFMKSLLLITEPLSPMFPGFISFENGYLRQAADGNFHLGVRSIPSKSMDKDFYRPAFDMIGRFFPEVFPFLRDIHLIRGFAGITAWTPDELPIVDAAPGIGGLFLAAGFSGHGFCIGPMVGKLLTEWIIDGRPSMDIEGLRWTRFLKG